MLKKKEYIYAAIAICFWGSTAAVAKLLLQELSTITVLFFNCITATLFLFVLNLCTGRLKQLKSLPVGEYFKTAALGLMGMFLYNLFLYTGLDRLQAQQAFIINYLWPILTVVFSCIFFRKRLTMRKTIALLVSFFGVIIVATEGRFAGLAQVDLLGVLASLGAAVSYALFSVLNMKYTKCDKYVATMLFYASAAVMSLFLLPSAGPFPALSGVQIIGMLWNGILTNGVAYTMWALALDHGDTAKISNLAYITPFLSLVYTYFLLREQIKLPSFIGLGFVVLGVLIQMERSRKANTK